MLAKLLLKMVMSCTGPISAAGATPPLFPSCMVCGTLSPSISATFQR